MKHSPIMQMYYREEGFHETVPHSDEYQRLNALYFEKTEKLKALFKGNPAYVNAFEDTLDAFIDVETQNCDDHYLAGFRFGASIMLDVLLGIT